MTITARPSTADLLFAQRYLETLGAGLDGELITPGRETYDQARKVIDITIDRRPLAIVRAATARDIAAGVSFARDYGLDLAIRSGGHSLAGHSMVDDAMVIDLSAMKGIQIDPAARIARVQAGVTSGDFAGPANAHGLALSTGDTASVGFGGLTTGGGIGYMVRKYGLAIDNLLSAQVVTAAGAVVTASETEHPDLFWAIRGGGGNFGVVSEFTFRLAPVGQILGGMLVLPATPEVIRGYLEYTATAPDELSTIANVMHAPPLPFIPEAWAGKLVLAIIACWTGNSEDGARAYAPLRALAEPVADLIGPIPYPGIYDFTAHQTLPHGVAIRSMFADELSDATIAASLTAMEQATSPYSIVHLRGLGGALARVAPDATAFAHRDARYLYAVIGIWLDASEDPQVHTGWTQALWEQVGHERTGVYVNFLDNEGPERIFDAYPPATYARLAAIKRRYDPQNLFRLNQNIAPTR